MNGEEGLLSTQVCDVLGITPQNFNQVVKRNNLMLSTLSLKPTCPTYVLVTDCWC